jgi:hypothetical protein
MVDSQKDQLAKQAKAQQDQLVKQAEVQQTVIDAEDAAQRAAQSATNAVKYASDAAQSAAKADTIVKTLTGDIIEVELAKNARNNAADFAKQAKQYSNSAVSASQTASSQLSNAKKAMNIQTIEQVAGTNAQFVNYTQLTKMYAQLTQQSATNASQQEEFANEAAQQAEQQANAAQQAVQQAYIIQQEEPGQQSSLPPGQKSSLPPGQQSSLPPGQQSSLPPGQQPTTTPIKTADKNLFTKITTTPSTSLLTTSSKLTSQTTTTPSIVKTSKPFSTPTPSQERSTNSSQIPFDKDASLFFKTNNIVPTTTPYVKRDLVDQPNNSNQIPLPTKISTNEEFLNAVNSILNLPYDLSIDKLALNIIKGLLSTLRSSNAATLMNEVIKNYNADPRSVLQYMNWFASTCPVDCNNCN